MDHKSSIKIIVSGLAAVLYISFGIIFHDSGGGDTYVIVNSGSEIESETETEAQGLQLRMHLKLRRKRQLSQQPQRQLPP
ncbi:MAG: hypothetical protein LUD57_01625 [Ruminococcus sp.]|nr:hypothetical protein [Ruminococcus sp.]